MKAAACLRWTPKQTSLHAYPEKVCLIQISTTGGDHLLDPLAGIN